MCRLNDPDRCQDAVGRRQREDRRGLHRLVHDEHRPLCAAAKCCSKASATSRICLWVAPPTATDAAELTNEGHYGTFGTAGARMEMPGCSLRAWATRRRCARAPRSCRRPPRATSLNRLGRNTNVHSARPNSPRSARAWAASRRAMSKSGRHRRSMPTATRSTAATNFDQIAGVQGGRRTASPRKRSRGWMLHESPAALGFRLCTARGAVRSPPSRKMQVVSRLHIVRHEGSLAGVRAALGRAFLSLAGQLKLPSLAILVRWLIRRVVPRRRALRPVACAGYRCWAGGDVRGLGVAALMVPDRLGVSASVVLWTAFTGFVAMRRWRSSPPERAVQHLQRAVLLRPRGPFRLFEEIELVENGEKLA